MTIDWSWISGHTDDLTTLTVSHLQAALGAVLLGLLMKKDPEDVANAYAKQHGLVQ